eukprot:11163992-Lingulodinium_polyedra.AAC.1
MEPALDHDLSDPSPKSAPGIFGAIYWHESQHAVVRRHAVIGKTPRRGAEQQRLAEPLALEVPVVQ